MSERRALPGKYVLMITILLLIRIGMCSSREVGLVVSVLNGIPSFTSVKSPPICVGLSCRTMLYPGKLICPVLSEKWVSHMQAMSMYSSPKNSYNSRFFDHIPCAFQNMTFSLDMGNI